jgi:hypothetical protein
VSLYSYFSTKYSDVRLPSEHSQRTANPKKKRKVSAGRDPWTNYVSPLFPPTSNTWKDALERVNNIDDNLRTTPSTNPCYKKWALPDAHLIATPAKDEKKLLYLIAWLQARPSLIFQARKQLTLSHRSQLWREFLEMTAPQRNSSQSSSSKAALYRQQLTEIYTFLLCETTLPLSTDSPVDPSPLSPAMWRGHQITLENPPNARIFCKVLWDLNECNFRLEFFALDCLASRHDLSTEDRLRRLCSCFDPVEFLPPSFPTSNRGLVAQEWHWRIDPVIAFVKILSTWTDLPRILETADLERFRRHIPGDQRDFEDLEARAARFYCQSFFNFFDRAPSIPRFCHIPKQ